MARKTDLGRYCRDCIYYRGQFDESLCCNYIFDENTHRPCPPGKECTVKKKRPRKRRIWEDRYNAAGK